MGGTRKRVIWIGIQKGINSATLNILRLKHQIEIQQESEVLNKREDWARTIKQCIKRIWIAFENIGLNEITEGISVNLKDVWIWFVGQMDINKTIKKLDTGTEKEFRNEWKERERILRRGEVSLNWGKGNVLRREKWPTMSNAFNMPCELRTDKRLVNQGCVGHCDLELHGLNEAIKYTEDRIEEQSWPAPTIFVRSVM